MSVNIAETFELLFNKNNNVAYKALQELQKESEKTDCVYPYMERSRENQKERLQYLAAGTTAPQKTGYGEITGRAAG